MSVESCTAFLEHALADPDLGERMRAVTDTRELVVLGRRSGYAFEIEDLLKAASTMPATRAGVP